MIKKALSLIAAIAAMAAAAGVCIVAAAYALFAVVRIYLGPAGGAAVVAGVAAVVVLTLALVLARKASPREVARHMPPPEQQGLAGRLIELAREKPIIAAGAAVAAGLVLIRNPKLITTLATVAMANRAGKAAGKAEERRR